MTHMNSFDYIAEARDIRDELGEDLAEWKARIDDAIAGGSTGTEILMAVRWNLAEMLKAKHRLPVHVVMRINDYVIAANKLLSNRS